MGASPNDFNNILGVILNYAEFVGDELEPDSQAREDVEEIRRAAERAALRFLHREAIRRQIGFLIQPPRRLT